MEAHPAMATPGVVLYVLCMARPISRTTERWMSAEEFARLPEEEDASRVELVRGRLVRSPRPATLHGRLLVRLGRMLDEFVETAGTGVVLGDPGVLLAREPDTVRGPDLAYYSRARIPDAEYAVTFWGPPDLAVEINSPHDRASEVQEKVTEYLEAGVRLVWVFDPPTRTVTAYRPDGSARILAPDATLAGDDVLPDFRLPLAGFFAL
jgi:Uma2 family endonuclease